jgi:uncharacterized protein with FMN-binding domain
MRAAKPLAALALTAAGSALVVGFQVPEAGAIAAADASTGANSAATDTASSSGSTGSTGASSTTSGSTAAGSGSGSGSTTAGSTATDAEAAGATGATAQYADGTYLGAAVGEPWGTFQVQAVVSGGQLVDVTIVSAPTDRHSSRINNASIPRLTSQALASQSADVDVISGATWTSESYAASLQAALDDAAATLEAAA